MPIVARTGTALWRRLQSEAVQDCRPWLWDAPFDLPHQHAQVTNHSFEDTGPQPALCLLVDCVPGRQITGHHAPLHSRMHNVAQSVQDLTQRMLTLWSVFLHQNQIRGCEDPLIITHVARLWFPVHTLSVTAQPLPVVIGELKTYYVLWCPAAATREPTCRTTTCSGRIPCVSNRYVGSCLGPRRRQDVVAPRGGPRVSGTGTGRWLSDHGAGVGGIGPVFPFSAFAAAGLGIQPESQLAVC